MNDANKIEIDRNRKDIETLKQKQSKDKREIYNRIDKLDLRCTELEKADIKLISEVDRLIEKMDELIDSLAILKARDGENWRKYIGIIGAGMVGAIVSKIMMGIL